MTEAVAGAPERGRAGEIVSVAVTGALLSATIYLSVAGYRHFVAHTFVPMSQDGVWMSPLSYLIFFLVPAFPLVVLAATGRLTRTSAIRSAVVLSVWLTIFAILLPVTAIHRAAAAVLAAGGAVAMGRLVVGNPSVWLPRLRQLRAVTLVLLVGVVLGTVGSRTVATRRAYASLRSLGSAGADAPPNVLLIILDTVRAASMSLYGYGRATTPQIDAFAARGVVFDWAMAAAPWTLPSHASMFTGQYAGRLSTGFSQTLDTHEPTLAEVFRDRGYETAGFVANQHYVAWDSGLDRGFLTYFDFPTTFVQLLKSSWFGQSMVANELYRAQSRDDVIRILKNFKLYVPPKPEGDENSATDLTDRVLRWQATRQAGPFFAFLNYYDAHTPYKPSPKWRQKFADKPKARDLYEADIAYMDDEIGRLLRTLDARGVLTNTLVIIASDHGEQFGEHTMYGHGNSLYLPLLHVPLVIVQPGRVPAGVRVTRTISLRDLAATVAAQAGLDSVGRFPGSSLATFWRDSAATGSTALAELYRSDAPTAANSFERSKQYALVDDSLHYVWRGNSKPELYAYRGDPTEATDRAGTTVGRPTATAMHQRVVEEIRRDTTRRR